MDDLDTGFHAGLRPVVSDRTRYTAKPKTPYFNIVKQIQIQINFNSIRESLTQSHVHNKRIKISSTPIKRRSKRKKRLGFSIGGEYIYRKKRLPTVRSLWSTTHSLIDSKLPFFSAISLLSAIFPFLLLLLSFLGFWLQCERNTESDVRCIRVWRRLFINGTVTQSVPQRTPTWFVAGEFWFRTVGPFSKIWE